MRDIVILILFLLSIKTCAQSKNETENAFLKEINVLYADTNAESLGIGLPDKKTITEPFTFNKEGILSVTIKRVNESGHNEISKMEVSMNKLKEVLYDRYLILLFEKDSITWRTFRPDKNTIVETTKGTMLHIGIPLPEDEIHQIRMQELVDGVLKFYR